MSQENVINISFKKQNPITQNLQEYLELEDPIEDLLQEFDQELDMAGEMSLESPDQKYKLSYGDTTRHMTDVLLSQTKQLRENMSRLTYYLDEMNLES